MDKKIYTIEINGIEANIRKIDDLNQRLQVLDTRLRDLPADININLPKMDASVSSSISNAVAGGGGTSQTAELRQQQQALTQHNAAVSEYLQAKTRYLILTGRRTY